MIEADFGKLAKFIVCRYKGRDFVQLFLDQSNGSAPSPKRAPLLRYGFTLITISLALLLTLGVPAIRSGTPFVFFFLAVALSAWYGGLRAGLFSIVLGIFSVNFWVFPPSAALSTTLAQAIQTVVFLAVAGVIVWLVFVFQQTQNRLYVERLALHLTLASIGDAVIVTDLSEKVSWMNDVAASVTGWSAAEAVGHPLTEVFPIVNEQTQAPVENPVRRVLEEGKIVGLANHTVLLARDGVARPIEDSAAPIRDKGGNLSGVVLIFRDVTERRQAELATARLAQQVQQEQERLAGLIADVPGVVWEAWGQPDAQTQRIDFVSDYVESLLGYSKAEWLAVPNFWLSIVHPDDKAAAARKAAADFNSGEGGVNQFRWLTKDGQALYCEAVASVIKDAAGQPLGMRGITFDRTAHKQAEEVLVRYQLLSERARDIILYIGQDARIIEANGAAVAAYGYDRATLLTMHVYDLRDPATVVAVATQMAQADTGGILFETRHRRKDGTTFPVEVSSIGADISGERVLLSIIRDITERKQAEVDLRESEERFRATFDQAAVGMAQISPDGHYVRVNERLCEIIGYSRAELLQKTYQAITHPDDLAADVAQTERLLAGEITSYRLEKRYLHKNEDSIWTTMTRSAVRNAAGVVQYGVAVIEDISARKAAEARLHFLAEASAVLTASLDYAITLQRVADLMVLHLADWCAVDIVGADGALELAAVAHVDPTKVQWARALREQSPPDMNAAYGLPNVVRTGVAEFYPEISEELILRSEPDDEELAIIRQVGFKSVIIVPLQARGQVLGGLTLVWSNSDRHYTQADLHFAEEVAHRAALAVDNVRLYQEARQAEAQLRQLNETLELRVAERTAELRQSNEDLDRFAYVASHDLKSPLRAIDHLSNWIVQDAAEQLPAASQEHLGKLRGRVKRMERLLDDLLAYSRADRFKYAKQNVDTAALVDDVAQLVTPIEGFSVITQAPMPILLTERVPLELVLRNLIDNAIKHHHRAEGQVWVTARDLGRMVEFSVRDDGPGMDEKFSDRIFQMFQTLRPRDQVEGSGMGLAIVKKVVESRGGTLHVESTPGRGATFRFTWPKT